MFLEIYIKYERLDEQRLASQKPAKHRRNFISQLILNELMSEVSHIFRDGVEQKSLEAEKANYLINSPHLNPTNPLLVNNEATVFCTTRAAI